MGLKMSSLLMNPQYSLNHISVTVIERKAANPKINHSDVREKCSEE